MTTKLAVLGLVITHRICERESEREKDNIETFKMRNIFTITILVVNLRGGLALHLDISDKLKLVSILLITIFHKQNELICT